MYLVPFIFFSTIMIAEKLKKIKQYINEESLNRQIKIKSIIHNNLNDLQSAINYV